MSSCDVAVPGVVSHWHYKKIDRAFSRDDPETYFRELLLEKARLQKFPNCVSRLTGVFLFKTEADARRAQKEWVISQLRTELTDVGFSAQSVSMHDSNWLINREVPIADFAEAYWSGKPMNESPLWEIIASGIGRVLEREVQVRCYRKTYYRWPASSVFLKGATLLFADGKEKAGLSVPFVQNVNNRIIESIIMYDDDFKKFDLNQDNPILKEFDLPVHKEDCENPRAPDLGEFFFDYPLSKAHDPRGHESPSLG